MATGFLPLFRNTSGGNGLTGRSGCRAQIWRSKAIRVATRRRCLSARKRRPETPTPTLRDGPPHERSGYNCPLSLEGIAMDSLDRITLAILIFGTVQMIA